MPLRVWLRTKTIFCLHGTAWPLHVCSSSAISVLFACCCVAVTDKPCTGLLRISMVNTGSSGTTASRSSPIRRCIRRKKTVRHAMPCTFPALSSISTLQLETVSLVFNFSIIFAIVLPFYGFTPFAKNPRKFPDGKGFSVCSTLSGTSTAPVLHSTCRPYSTLCLVRHCKSAAMIYC